jgi:hypothetical protein
MSKYSEIDKLAENNRVKTLTWLQTNRVSLSKWLNLSKFQYLHLRGMVGTFAIYGCCGVMWGNVWKGGWVTKVSSLCQKQLRILKMNQVLSIHMTTHTHTHTHTHHTCINTYVIHKILNFNSTGLISTFYIVTFKKSDSDRTSPSTFPLNGLFSNSFSLK